RRRRKSRAAPTPSVWLEILKNNVQYFELLEPAERDELLSEMKVFLSEKQFDGCAGFEVTEEVRVTIAAQACLLLLGRETECYPELKLILVYPHPYATTTKRVQADGTVIEGAEGRLGESWHRGSLILAWDAVKSGAVDVHDGHNVVFHEFAHQLDSESGAVEGAPRLADRAGHAQWARVMQGEYAHLLDALESGHKTVIDRYGATNPAEFFAVVTEVFFEKPRALESQHPALYALLKGFYRQDPAARLRRHKAG
ncbi:MAG: zinc-dependent peptidase, partial [Planctomycetes bacterium]|nr:zinc-dependent peptidase [Planctomycetota bacterium]